MTSKVNDLIRDLLGIGTVHQHRLLASLLVVLGLWLLRRIVLRIVGGRYDDVRVRYQWRKSSTYVAVVIGVLLIGRIWFEGFHSLSTFLGLLSAGLAIALQTPVMNFAGWIFLLWRRPFEVGDRIEIGTDRGDVIDLRIFMFTMMEIGNWVDADQSTGRVIHVPNGRIFSLTVANYSKGFQYIWDELAVPITFESDWKKAKDILRRIALKNDVSAEAGERVREAADRYLIYYRKLTPIVYTAVRENGVELTIRYLTEPRRRRGAREAIWEDVLDAFAEHQDIAFAYPTIRRYVNSAEGKPGAGGPPPPQPAE